MTTGPSAQRPKQPVLTTLTSSVSPVAAISFSNSSIIFAEPEDVQPVPPQQSTWERYMVRFLLSYSLLPATAPMVYS